MPKKNSGVPRDSVGPASQWYAAMCRVMDELAFRGPAEEALVMRIAKAGNVTEVMTAIKRRRIYGKKMAGKVARVPDDGANHAPKRGTKRRKDRKVPLSGTPLDPGPTMEDAGDQAEAV
jgi:hypothetical protein